ncbi:MAG: SDR family oxidoreductase, partial [Myxococcota bacterium]|nr:SDR family oxidoreductase [Myxococcota bacterium]
DALGLVVDRTLQEFGRIDVLVNGAAGNFLCPAAQLSPNGFRTVLEIDTAGTFNASRAVFDRWFSEHGGNIINISATLHYGSTPLQVHAAAAKSAVDALTRTLAAEWGPAGVRINAIAPGPIDETEGIARLLPQPTRARLEGTIPIRRMGRIDEIAKVALFLAADASSLVHGEILVADGGAWLTGSRLVAMPA